MHDGTTPLDGAPDCVAQLHAQGKRIIILSNSSALSSSALERLPRLGFDPSCLVGAVTSGEEASHFLRKKYQGKCGLFLTWKATPTSYSATKFVKHCGDITVTDQVSEADFVLLHGLEVIRGPGEDGTARETPLGDFKETGDASTILEPLLQQCLARCLPLICVNPDYIYVQADGSVWHMPGKVANLYEDLGGTVVRFGKPHKEHFEACIRVLGLPKDRVVHVGDSLHHDIAGANAAGVACILVTGGVHKRELNAEHCVLPSKEALENLFATHGHTPTHVVPLLRY